MGETPSRRRRKGREAFDPRTDPMLVQPYKVGSWSYKYHLQDFLDGWKEAEKQWEEEQEEEEESICPYCGQEKGGVIC